jgi:hypothetical protein
MPILSSVVQNGWTFVQGVTAPDSFDAVGPAESVAKDLAKGSIQRGTRGAHFAGGYPSGGSTVVLKAFYDSISATQLPIGYIQTVEARCLDLSVPAALFPGLAGKLSYSDPASDVFLDFMGATDAIARFGGERLAGDAVADAPFRPFDAFLRFPDNRFDIVFWHPLPFGSMQPRDGWSPPQNTRTNWNDVPGAVSRVASLRTVVTPFVLREAQLAALCRDDDPIFFYDWPADSADTNPLYDLVKRMYEDPDKLGEYVNGQLLTPMAGIVDAIAAGRYLVLVTDNGEAIVATITDRTASANGPVRRVRIWEIDHDTFEGMERAAATETLERLQAHMEQHYDWFHVPDHAQPEGRGWSRAAMLPGIAYDDDEPTFSLIFRATATRWKNRSPTSITSEAQFLSTIETRIDWNYNRTEDIFDVTVQRPELLDYIDPDAQALWNRYQQILYLWRPATGGADPAPFTLAGAPWLDDAPAYHPDTPRGGGG